MAQKKQTVEGFLEESLVLFIKLSPGESPPQNELRFKVSAPKQQHLSGCFWSLRDSFRAAKMRRSFIIQIHECLKGKFKKFLTNRKTKYFVLSLRLHHSCHYSYQDEALVQKATCGQFPLPFFSLFTHIPPPHSAEALLEFELYPVPLLT